MPKRGETAASERARIQAEQERQHEREEHAAQLAVIAEFGGRKPARLLVPADDPAHDRPALRMAAEILDLCHRLAQLARAVGYAQARQPFAVFGPRPQAPDDKPRLLS
jgi:hypothetical protein